MKALKYIFVMLLTIIITALAVFLIAAAVAPKTFKVERKIIIQASPQKIFTQVNSLSKWQPWNPWLQKDSTIKNTYTGPVAGVGSKSSWTSKKSGSGSMEITESVPDQSIRIQLAFNNFSPSQIHFTFTVLDDSTTEVVWADSGSMSYPMNVFTLFMDKAMGPDFETGLQNLKAEMESMPDWKLSEFKLEEQTAQPILAVMDSCASADIGKMLGNLYGEIGAVMKQNNLNFAAQPMAYYYSFTPEKVILEAAVPVEKVIKGNDRVKGRITSPGKALTATFFGDYALMSQAVPAIKDYMKANKLVQNGPECDVYMNDPTTVEDKMKIETKMIFPVRQE